LPKKNKKSLSHNNINLLVNFAKLIRDGATGTSDNFLYIFFFLLNRVYAFINDSLLIVVERKRKDERVHQSLSVKWLFKSQIWLTVSKVFFLLSEPRRKKGQSAKLNLGPPLIDTKVNGVLVPFQSLFYIENLCH